MIKYLGKYRINCEWDKNSLEPIKDDLFISCYKDAQIYRAYENKLAYYRPSRGNSEVLARELMELGVDGVNNCSTDGDILIYFDEKDIDIVANKVGVITSGANISPYSIKNLRKLDWFKKDKEKYVKLGLYSELSEEEKEVYRQRFREYIKKE